MLGAWRPLGAWVPLGATGCSWCMGSDGAQELQLGGVHSRGQAEGQVGIALPLPLEEQEAPQRWQPGSVWQHSSEHPAGGWQWFSLSYSESNLLRTTFHGRNKQANRSIFCSPKLMVVQVCIERNGTLFSSLDLIDVNQ